MIGTVASTGASAEFGRPKATASSVGGGFAAVMKQLDDPDARTAPAESAQTESAPAEAAPAASAKDRTTDDDRPAETPSRDAAPSAPLVAGLNMASIGVAIPAPPPMPADSIAVPPHPTPAAEQVSSGILAMGSQAMGSQATPPSTVAPGTASSNPGLAKGNVPPGKAPSSSPVATATFDPAMNADVLKLPPTLLNRFDALTAISQALLDDLPDAPMAPTASIPSPAMATMPALVPLPAAGQIGDQLGAQLGEATLQMSSDGQWLDHLARDIAELANGEGRLRFRLDPPHLGALRVDIANGSDGVTMRLTTDTEAARTILADAHNRLIAEARAQGLRIADSRIESASPFDAGAQFGGGGRNANPAPSPIAFRRDRSFAVEVPAPAAAPVGERFA